MKKLLSLALTATAVLLLSPTSHANTITTYSSPSSFSAAAGPGLTIYGFPAVNGFLEVGSPYTQGPLTFSNDTYTYIFNDGFYGTGQTYLGNDFFTSDITSGGSYALGFLLGSFYGPDTVGVTIDGVSQGSISVPGSPNTTFYGVIATGPITDITFTHNGELDVIAFEESSTPVVPEPSSLALLTTGVLGLGGLVRRRFQRS